MPPQLRNRNILNVVRVEGQTPPPRQPAVEPLLRPGRPERPETPEGQAVTVRESVRGRNSTGVPVSAARNHLPPPPHALPVPVDTVQQLVELLNHRTESDVQRSLRIDQIEAELAELRAREISDRTSPRRRAPRQKTSARRRHRSPVRRRFHHHTPVYRRGRGSRSSSSRSDDDTYEPDFESSPFSSSLASSSPRRRSRSVERDDRSDRHHRHRRDQQAQPIQHFRHPSPLPRIDRRTSPPRRERHDRPHSPPVRND